MNLKPFKSGTDIRGFAAEEYSSEVTYLSDEIVAKISYAFAQWLSLRSKKPTSELFVSIGHDSRISASRIKAAAVKILTSMGIEVKDCGLASTPACLCLP